MRYLWTRPPCSTDAPLPVRTFRFDTRTACLTTACTSRCGVPSAPESILSTEQAEPSCRPGPNSRSKKAPRRSGASVEDEDQCLNSRARRCRGQESCNHMPHDRVMALGGLPIAAGLLALRSDATRPGEPLRLPCQRTSCKVGGGGGLSDGCDRATVNRGLLLLAFGSLHGRDLAPLRRGFFLRRAETRTVCAWVYFAAGSRFVSGGPGAVIARFRFANRRKSPLRCATNSAAWRCDFGGLAVLRKRSAGPIGWTHQT